MTIRNGFYVFALGIISSGIILGCGSTQSQKATTSSVYSPNKKWKPTDLLIDEKATLTPPAELTEDMVETDADFLAYALSTAYGGREFVPQDVFSKAIQDISALDKKMKPVELKDRIDEILMTVPDNHLLARLSGVTSPARQAAVKKGQVGPNGNTDKNRVWQAKMDQQGSRKILYVSLKEIGSAQDERFKGFIGRVKWFLKDADRVVIDLRGATGTDDEIGFELAKVFYGNPVDSAITVQHFSQTPETLAASANTYRIFPMEMKASGGTPPEYFNELFKEKVAKFEEARSGKLPPKREVPKDNKKQPYAPDKGYHKTVFVLIDGECSGICENTVMALENYPKLKTVGVNTAGAVHFGNSGYVLLPNSKIQVQIPTLYNELAGKRFIEKTGLRPEVEVPAGKDAYQFLIQKGFSTKL